MKKRITEITVMVEFEQRIEIPLELQKDEKAINRLADEMMESDEMLTNLTDSGIVRVKEVYEYEKEYVRLEEETI